MKAQTLTPAEIFGYQTRYVVPLFQRPYVWSEQRQWGPLWDDIRTVAENLLAAPGTYGVPAVAPHFLGAIVVDVPHGPPGFIAARYVIDGQQRLTTLQLVLDAAQLVAERVGTPADATALRVLVLNTPEIAQEPSEVFKVWPTDRDQAAFVAAMDNDRDVPADLAATAIARAHVYFVEVIQSWAQVAGPDLAAARVRALTQVLRSYLKLVVIDLEPGDNAQVIFETLNHRGEPLLAADLIKNFVFQRATDQHLDTKALYQRYWRELDDDFWRVRVSRGRQLLPRIDIFVSYWLVMRLRREVPADRVFVTFRDWVLEEKLDVEDLLADLSSDAKTYVGISRWPNGSAVGRFRYRVIEALDSAVVTPVLLWLLRQPAAALPAEQRDKALASIESWIVRRALCRLTAKDLNRLVVELLRELDQAGPAKAGDAVERFLLGQGADSRFWPSDDFVREVLGDAPLYKTLVRARVRMLLEAIEDRTRSDKSEQAECPRNLTVEHVLPQAWREHWLADIDTDADGPERDKLVHVLGNLTLLTQKLNSGVSNRPWTDAEAKARELGGKGKRSELLQHTVLKINSDLIANEHWGHDEIRARNARLVELVLDIWPRPAKKVAAEISPEAAEKDAVPPGMPEDDSSAGKYGPLTDWLLEQTADEIPMTFEDLEEIIGQELAPSARSHRSYWSSTANALGKAVAAGNYRATSVDLAAESVVFRRRR